MQPDGFCYQFWITEPLRLLGNSCYLETRRGVSEEEAATHFASLARRVTIYCSKRLTKSQSRRVSDEIVGNTEPLRWVGNSCYLVTRSVSDEVAAAHFASLTRRVTICCSKRLIKSQPRRASDELVGITEPLRLLGNSCYLETRSVSEEEAATHFASLTRRVTIYCSKRLIKSQPRRVSDEIVGITEPLRLLGNSCYLVTRSVRASARKKRQLTSPR